MDAKNQEVRDMVRRLKESLDASDAEAPETDAPDEVFSGQSTVPGAGDTDEDRDFDALMAKLLGEVTDDGHRTAGRSDQTSEPVRKEAEEPEEVREWEDTEPSEREEDQAFPPFGYEEAPQTGTQGVGLADGREADRPAVLYPTEETPAEELSGVERANVELPGEGSDAPTPMRTPEEQTPAVGKNTPAPTEESQTATENTRVTAQPGPIPPERTASPSAEEGEGASVLTDRTGAGIPSGTEEEQPPVLQEGDLLLDETEALPQVPVESKESKESKAEKSKGMPTPETVSGETASERDKTAAGPSRTDGAPDPIQPKPSPLDAIRRAEAAQEEAVRPKPSPLDAARRAEAAQEPVRPKPSPLDAITSGQSSVGMRRGNVIPPNAGQSSGKREKPLSDEDVTLLVDLGYENYLTQKVGSQRIETAKCTPRDRSDQNATRAYGYCGEEYTGHTQDKEIRDQYVRCRRRAIWSAVLTGLLALLCLALDSYPAWEPYLPTVMQLLPVDGIWYRLLGLSLMTLTVLPLGREMLDGGRALFRLSPVPATIPALLWGITALYDCFLIMGGGTGPALNFPTGMALFLYAVARSMDMAREHLTFEVVSARSRKIVAEHMEPRKKKVVRGGHIVKIMNDEAQDQLLRIRPTDTVSGFFRRCGEPSRRYGRIGWYVVVSVNLALLVSCVAFITDQRPGQAAGTFVLMMQLCLPICAVFGFVTPQWLAARQLSRRGCAIIGREAEEEYAGDKTLIFDDTEMFRSKSSTEITIQGSGDPKRYIRYAKRLFRTLGGTLGSVSTSDLGEDPYGNPMEIIKVYEDGVEARADGKVHVLAGSSAFLAARGIRVPDENAELLVRRQVESCILYLAFDGKLRLGYEIDYRISGRFEQMVARLARQGTAVAVYSCDPNMNDAFLERSRRSGSVPVHVIKPTRFDWQAESHLSDSGIVATRSARDIGAAVDCCDRLTDNDRKLRHYHTVAVLLGAVTGAALTFWEVSPVAAMLAAALVPSLFCLIGDMMTRKNLSDEDETTEYEKERERK